MLSNIFFRNTPSASSNMFNAVEEKAGRKLGNIENALTVAFAI